MNNFKNMFKKLFSNEEKEVQSLIGDGVTIQTVKHVNKSKDNEFLDNFDLTKTISIEKLNDKNISVETIEMSLEPKKLSTAYKALLKQSIVISLDFPIKRFDLEFIANSKIDGKPIYRYIGSDFSTFDLPFEEVASLECGMVQNAYNKNNRKYASSYTDYLMENIDKSIKYSEYIAEHINRV